MTRYFLFMTCVLYIGCKDERLTRTNVFHYNQVNYITSLDPAYAKTQNNIWVIDHLFNQLIDLNDSMQIIPEIAKSWQISQDGLRYVFELRTDIPFHKNACFGSDSSRYLTADDIVFSFKRLLDPAVNSPGSWIFKNKVDDTNPFIAINDSIFELRLKYPFSPLLNLLTMQYCSIIPEEAIEFYKEEISKNPVGTGPFKLKTWLGRRGMFLTKNTEYFKKGYPKLDGVRISFIEDRNTAYLDFLKNKIDFFSGLQSGFALQLVTREGYLRVDQSEKIQMLKGDYLNTEYIGINMNQLQQNPALKDRRVRRALNLSIDRITMLKLLKFNIGAPATKGFIPKGLPTFKSEETSALLYNPDSARTLLELAGYPNGRNIKPITIHTNKDYIDIITFVAKQWEMIGIQVQIDLVETSTLREKMRQSEYTFFRASWIADYPDAESFLNVFYSNNPAPPNYTRFNNALYDKLYLDAIKETDFDRRNLLYHKMNQIIIEESPVIFLYYDQTAWFAQKTIKNLKSNPINVLQLETVEDLSE
jgi:oligopeptide transport system substrate-binding protein